MRPTFESHPRSTRWWSGETMAKPLPNVEIIPCTQHGNSDQTSSPEDEGFPVGFSRASPRPPLAPGGSAFLSRATGPCTPAGKRAVNSTSPVQISPHHPRPAVLDHDRGRTALVWHKPHKPHVEFHRRQSYIAYEDRFLETLPARASGTSIVSLL